MTINSATKRPARPGGGSEIVHVCTDAARPTRSGRGSARGVATGTRSSKTSIDAAADVLLLPSNRPGPARIGEIGAQEGHPSRRASMNSTGCSAAASCRARSPCSAASRASARARCCSSCSRPGRARRSTSRAEESAHQVRRRAERLGRDARRPVAPCRDVAAAHPRGDRPTRSPSWSSSTRSRPSTIPRSPRARAASSRSAAARTGSSSRPRSATSRSSSSATSPRTAGSPARGCSSTWSTPSCSSRATATTRCGCCAPSKHRFGPTNELGLFEMGHDGLAGVPDPSTLFLADRRAGVAGSAVVPTMEGHRPLARRGAGADRPGVAGRAAAAQRPGPRRRPPVDADGGARAAGRDVDRRAGRLRLHRRRRAS